MNSPATAEERTLVSGRGTRLPMSITDQFWQFAKEAILSATAAKTDEDRESLLELARTWTQAALQVRQRTPSSALSSPGAKGARHVY